MTHRQVRAWGEHEMKIRGALGAVAIGALVAVPTHAHHSLDTEFDTRNCRDFTGTLARLDWQNPHLHFFMDIKDARGIVETWSFEGYSATTMARSGTAREVLLDHVGQEVSVRGCLARGTARRAAATMLKLSDGRWRRAGNLRPSGENGRRP